MPKSTMIYINDVEFLNEMEPMIYYEVTATGIVFRYTVSKTWTYSGSNTFLGFSTTQGGTTPSSVYEIGDTGSYTVGEIVYLYSVEESTPSISDLTNTTWLINSVPGDSGTGSSEYYSITFTSNSMSFVAMVVSGQTGVTYTYDTPVPGEYGYVPTDFSWETYDWGYWDDLEGSLTSIPELRTITITGGTDVTNSDLISWLQSNATQVGPIPSIVQNLFIGSPKMINGYLGDARISQIYYGNTLVWEREQVPVLYTITTTVTHGTYSGATYIETGETGATVTLSADSGYVLPSSITVTGASYTYSSSSGRIVLTNFTGNVTISAICSEQMPIKGDLIYIDMDGDGTAELYRVLKNVSGKTYEVLGMTDLTTLAYNPNDSNQYVYSALRTYLNSTWYNTLSSTAKAAIQSKYLNQYAWYQDNRGSTDYNGRYNTSTGSASSYTISYYGHWSTIGTSYIYPLEVQDVIDYLEVIPDTPALESTLNSPNVWSMFWNTSTKPDNNQTILLKSALYVNSGYIHCISAWGKIATTFNTSTAAVRPAFQINLSLIPWSFA